MVTSNISLWWRENGGLILTSLIGGVLGAGFGGIVWGVTLSNRITVLEERGSPAVVLLRADLEKRLTRVEERQNSVISTLQSNSAKLDSISDELRKHELEQRAK